MPNTVWLPRTTAANLRQNSLDQLGRSRSSQSVSGTRMSPYTFLCAHRLQRKHVRRYKRGVALSCDIPFKALLVRVLERIFSFFLSLSASFRELIQHSDFRMSPSMTSWTSGCNGGSVGTVGAKPIGSVLPMISWPASNTGRMPRPFWKVSAIGWRSSIWNWQRRKRDILNVGGTPGPTPTKGEKNPRN